jgi:hypothetical protein
LRAPTDFLGRWVGRRAGDDTAIVYKALIAKLVLPSSRISEYICAPMRFGEFNDAQLQNMLLAQRLLENSVDLPKAVDSTS